jgi:hypothetical protein
MNLFLNILLFLLQPVLRLTGVNSVQLKVLLKARLLIDNRRPNAMMKTRNKPIKWGNVLSILAGFLYGLILLMPFLFTEADDVALFMSLTLLTVLMGMLLITDFADVIYSTRDNMIVLPRPVDSKTFLMSRIVYVCIYMLRLAIPMLTPAVIALGLMYSGKAAALYLLLGLLQVLNTVFLANAAYLLLLRFVSASRIKNALNNIQILFSILAFGTYYLMPKIMESDAFKTLHLTDIKWLQVTPMYWSTATWTWIASNARVAPLLPVLTLLFPLVGLGIVIKFFAPYFASKLGDINEGEKAEPRKTKKEQTGKFSLAGLVCSNAVQRSFFTFVWKLTTRSRNFRMKVYPTFAFVPIYMLMMVMRKGEIGNFSGIAERLQNGSMFLIWIYSSCLTIIVAYTHVMYSDNFKAAWVYFVSPVSKPGEALAGTFKTLMIKFYLPFYLFISAACIAVWGAAVLQHLVLGMVHVTLFVLCMAYIMHRKLPFSMSQEEQNANGRVFLRSMLTLLVPAILGGLHYFAVNYWWALLVLFCISSVFALMLYRLLRQVTWTDMAK